MTIIPQLERDLRTAAHALQSDNAPYRSGPRRPRVRFAHLAQLAAVVVAVAVAGVFLSSRGRAPTRTTAPRAQQIVLSAHSPRLSPSSLTRDLPVLRARLRAVIPDARVTQQGARITVELPNPTSSERALLQILIAPGGLAVYDWEASVLTPSERSVARALPSDPSALLISQGDAAHYPGSPQAGALPLGAALTLARHAHTPDGLIALVRATGGTIEVRPRPATGRYFVLRGRPAFEDDVAGAHASTNPTGGSPAVTITLTRPGGAALHTATAMLALRGATLSGEGQTLNQHIAFVLDGHLLSVAAVDFRAMPDGIAPGAEVLLSDTGLSNATAQALAAILRSGPLAVALQVR